MLRLRGQLGSRENKDRGVRVQVWIDLVKDNCTWKSYGLNYSRKGKVELRQN